MSHRELYTSQPAVFSGIQKLFSEATYVVLGVPFDITSTYRTGARFAPLAIREASFNIETYSFRSNIDIENVRIHDSGDLNVTSDVDETLRRIEQVTKEITESEKTPILIGGEHTITLGAVKAMGKDFAILDFDAHMDLRNEYMNLRTSHTTFMRRINEQAKPSKIIEIGTRAVCREELNYAKKAGINFITVHEIREEGIENTVNQVKKLLGKTRRVYLTVDMDVLDPGFVPAVQNPEPDGLCTHMFYDLLTQVCDSRIVMSDVVEVSPPYDNGVTSIQAAKTIFEIMSAIERARK
jgi:agmatinase